MNLKFKLSERAQVVLILSAAVLALAAVWFFLLRPQAEAKRANRTMREQLAKSPFANLSIDTLNAAAKQEQKAASTLGKDWSDSALRITALGDYALLRRADVGRIDFQVELANLRQRLQAKAKNLNITLPPGLGISDALTSKETVRERLIHLKTVEKLTDLVIDQRILSIASLKTMPPVRHHAPDKTLICEEFPVEVGFATQFDSLFYLFSAMFEKDRVFAFDKIRITSDPTQADVLHIKAVMSSLIFP